LENISFFWSQAGLFLQYNYVDEVAVSIILTLICGLFIMKVFDETRGDLLPDPRYDAIGCIVIVLSEDGGKPDKITSTIVLIRDNQAHTIGRYLSFHVALSYRSI
jgi:hypothetical protein